MAKHPIYTDSKIPLCSANGVHGPQIAEWVIMMDLVHSHSYVKLWELQKKKEWKQSVGMQVSDRVGKRVGILGYGSIGRQGKFQISRYLLRWWKFFAVRLPGIPIVGAFRAPELHRICDPSTQCDPVKRALNQPSFPLRKARNKAVLDALWNCAICTVQDSAFIAQSYGNAGAIASFSHAPLAREAVPLPTTRSTALSSPTSDASPITT